MHRIILALFILAQLVYADTMPHIILQVGSRSFDVELADTPAAKALLPRLPITLDLTDLNANEKYGDLPEGLPTRAEAVGSIRAGDIMLFTPTCFVLFYKSFRTPYRYTRLGRIPDADSLPAALGRGDVTITLRAL